MKKSEKENREIERLTKEIERLNSFIDHMVEVNRKNFLQKRELELEIARLCLENQFMKMRD